MKRFFLQVYVLAMVGVLAAMLAIEHINNRFYAHDLEAEYLDYSALLVSAIRREIAAGGEESAVMAWWHDALEEHEGVNLALVERTAADTKARVATLSISEARDSIDVHVPFDETRVLSVSMEDAATPAALAAYYGGYILIYAVLAGLCAWWVWRLWRQIEPLRLHARQVAEGHYDAQLPPVTVSAFSDLHHDLTQMTRSLEQKTRENHVLTAAIHHELRTPITRLRLALDMAMTARDREAVPELLGDMDESLSHLSVLMEDLLLLSRLRLADHTLPTEPLVLDALVQRCIDSVQDARIVAELAPATLVGHRALLERAICNVLENACKHARTKIEVRLQSDVHGLVLQIGDDGPGIPEEEREWVLQPFYRIDKHRTRDAGGTGLGLALADLALRASGAHWHIGRSSLGGAAIHVEWRR